MKNSKLSNYVWGTLLVLNLLLLFGQLRNWLLARNQRTTFIKRDEVIDVKTLKSKLTGNLGEEDHWEKQWYNFIFIDLRSVGVQEVIRSLKETMAKLPKESVAILLVCLNDAELTNHHKALHEPDILFIADENLAVHRLFGASKCGSATVLMSKTGRVDFADIGLLNARELYLLLSSRVQG